MERARWPRMPMCRDAPTKGCGGKDAAHGRGCNTRRATCTRATGRTCGTGPGRSLVQLIGRTAGEFADGARTRRGTLTILPSGDSITGNWDRGHVSGGWEFLCAAHFGVGES